MVADCIDRMRTRLKFGRQSHGYAREVEDNVTISPPKNSNIPKLGRQGQTEDSNQAPSQSDA